MKTHRILALILALCLMAALTVSASATDFEDNDEILNQEAVDTLVALNIINGRGDGSFSPEGIVTRAEMSKLICVSLNGGKDPTTGIPSTPTFSDTKGHWAAGYIE